MILQGDALDLIQSRAGEYDLIVTDPPYAFGGSGDEHAISATVAVVLRESAKRLRAGGWMVVAAASSGRSQAYMIEAIRGIRPHPMEWVRTGTWVKPASQTKVKTAGWQWGSVSWLVFRRGKGRPLETAGLDWIECAPIKHGRRAELPPAVADWAVAPFALAGGRFVDPFAGSGALVDAAKRAGMDAIGFERTPAKQARLFMSGVHDIECDMGEDCLCGAERA